MAEVYICPARAEHISPIIEHLGQHAKRDMERIGNPVAKLEEDIAASDFCHVGFYLNTPAVVWGIQYSSMLERKGYIWMVSTDTIDRHPILFARYSKICLDDAIQEFDSLSALVRPTMERSRRWLKWLGFKRGPAQSLGDERFHWYVRTR